MKDVIYTTIILIGLVAAWAIGFISEGSEWCEKTEKMLETETLAPAVRHEFNERCK